MGSLEFKSENAPPVGGKVFGHLEGQLNSGKAINSAHNFLRPEVQSLTSPALVPGHNEPISPLIQMIMRMPGHIGLVNSFFEALQAFIMPHLDFLPHLDPSILAAHAQEAANSTFNHIGEHFSLDLAALPPEAHIFEQMHIDSSVLNDASKHLSSLDVNRHALEVSGEVDLSKPIYEGASTGLTQPALAGTDKFGLLAGPGLSGHGATTYLAGRHIIFSNDLFQKPSALSLANQPATASTSSTPPVSQALNAYRSDLNVTGSPFAPRMAAMPAGSDIRYGIGANGQPSQPSMNAGFHLGMDRNLTAPNALGPSGAVSDQLGGKHILAMNDQGIETIRPTVGSEAGVDQSSVYDRASLDNSSALPHGLRAKELSLDGKSHLSPQAGKGLHDSALQKGNPVASAHHITRLSKNAVPLHRAFSNNLANSTADSGKLAAQSGAHQQSDQPTTYTIRSGDCLWNIAKTELGDAARWKEIYNLNLDKIGSNPDLIYTGNSLKLPLVSQDVASNGLTAGKYMVRTGDNLWDISKHFLGSGDKWGQIYHTNSDVIGSNPRLIFPGQQLSMPGSDGTLSHAIAPHTQSACAALNQPMGDTHAAQAPQTVPSATANSAPLAISDASQATTLPPAGDRVLTGAGGAQAATLNGAPSNARSSTVVSPSLGVDLSFLGKKQR